MNHTAQISARRRFSRLASSAALVFTFLFALEHQLHAQTGMVVSFYNSGILKLYNDTGLTAVVPTPPVYSGTSLSVGGGGAEGLGCLTTGGIPTLFAANNSGSITVIDANAFTAIGNPVPIVGATEVAGLSLNGSGSALYAADWGTGTIWSLSPGNILTEALKLVPSTTALTSITTLASHDVAVDPNSPDNVYATGFFHSGLGVLGFSPSLSAIAPFISPTTSPSTTANVGLPGAAGILFESTHLWVSNFDGNAKDICSTTNASTPCASILEFDRASGNLLHKFIATPGSAPLGLALGPDGNIYAAMFSSGYIGQINLKTLATGSFPQIVPLSGSPLNDQYLAVGSSSEPKYVSFIESCTQATPNGYVEVCKASCPTNPVPSTGIYNFTVPGSAFSTNPLMVPVGECTGPIPVTAGTPIITELPTPGVSVCNVTAVGYGPSGSLTDLLVQFDPQPVPPATGSTAAVIVQAPPSSGDTSLETIVTFYNYEAPPAELKVCKIAGNGITQGTPFTFTTVSFLPPGTAGNVTSLTITNSGSGYTSAPAVTFTGGGCTTEPTATASISGGSVTGITLTSPGSGCTTAPVVTIGPPNGPVPNVIATATAVVSNGSPSATTTTVTVEAGPMTENGYCELVSGTFEVGTFGTVTETVPAGDGPPTVTVNGAPVTPSPCAYSAGGFPCSVTAAIGAGINEVSFTNACASGLPTCPQPNGGGPLPNLRIVNYSLVSQVAATGMQSYMTYRADILNTGATAVGRVVARMSSLVASAIQVVGQGELKFAPTPAYGQVPSSNTFTVLADPTVPLDFSKLSWIYYSSRSVPARR